MAKKNGKSNPKKDAKFSSINNANNELKCSNQLLKSIFFLFIELCTRLSQKFCNILEVREV